MTQWSRLFWLDLSRLVSIFLVGELCKSDICLFKRGWICIFSSNGSIMLECSRIIIKWVVIALMTIALVPHTGDCELIRCIWTADLRTVEDRSWKFLHNCFQLQNYLMFLKFCGNHALCSFSSDLSPSPIWHHSLFFLFLQGNFFASFLLGWSITTVSGICAYPFDTLRRRMMMTSGQPVKYRNAMHAFLEIIHLEGFTALFRGVTANMLMGMAGAGVLAGYDHLHRIASRHGYNWQWF